MAYDNSLGPQHSQFQPSLKQLDNDASEQISSQNDDSQAQSMSSVQPNNSAKPPSQLQGKQIDESELPKAQSMSSAKSAKVNSDFMASLKDAQKLSDDFVAVMTDKKVPAHVRNVMTVLDNAYDQFDFSRKKTDLDKGEFTKEAYRAALMKGAHIEFQDGGALLQELLKQGGQHEDGVKAQDGHFYNRKGESSHYFEYNTKSLFTTDYSYKQTNQYGADLGHAAKNSGAKPWVGHLLIGNTINHSLDKSIDSNWAKGNTFVQFENNGTASKMDKYVYHGSDYGSHRYNAKQQVGPMGVIEASEKPDKLTHLVATPSNNDI
ncbi:hypothetical protein [Chitinimonas lacunae]|uniref:Uncharacterized protein n=1 Tax=Chitinimonas lacunae TaxID=1963018 RepID=A0ABV8MST4_9NEIS